MDTADHKYRRFEALVLEQHVRVRAFVRSLGVQRDWVDDIAQEAFMVAYREWDAFDQSRDFGNWVRGIAANIARNEIRKHARQQRILHTELTHVLLHQQEGPADLDRPLALDAIRACLSKLSSANLEIVRGRYRDGLSATDLADRLGHTAAGVRQLLVRIRRQLRACVELRAAGVV
jgi:RNA polymerase sigma-70 factor (ECF subfamily)